MTKAAEDKVFVTYFGGPRHGRIDWITGAASQYIDEPKLKDGSYGRYRLHSGDAYVKIYNFERVDNVCVERARGFYARPLGEAFGESTPPRDLRDCQRLGNGALWDLVITLRETIARGGVYYGVFYSVPYSTFNRQGACLCPGCRFSHHRETWLAFEMACAEEGIEMECCDDANAPEALYGIVFRRMRVIEHDPSLGESIADTLVSLVNRKLRSCGFALLAERAVAQIQLPPSAGGYVLPALFAPSSSAPLPPIATVPYGVVAQYIARGAGGRVIGFNQRKRAFLIAAG